MEFPENKKKKKIELGKISRTDDSMPLFTKYTWKS